MEGKKSLAVIGILLASFVGALFVACAETDPDKKPSQSQGTEYTVTFDANGGTLTGNSEIKVKEGGKITQAPTATKAEHTFEAWYDAATGGAKIALDTYTVSKDVTLYAHYTANTVTPTGVKVTFNANGGKFAGDATTMEKTTDKNNNILDADEPTREGYVFKGWFTAATGGDAVDPLFDEIKTAQTLYAQWARQYTVTFNPNGGELVGASTVKVETGNKIKGAPDATKGSDDFYGWYTEAEEGEKIDFETYTVTDDLTLYAHFGAFSMPIKTLKDTDGTTSVGYRIEAENAKMTGQTNSENQAGTGFVENNQKTASGGSSIGYFGKAGNTMTIVFASPAAGKGTLTFMASSAQIYFTSDYSQMYPVDQNVTTSVIKVELNGTEVQFAPAKLRGSYENWTFNKYWDPIALGELDIIQGTNTVKVTVLGDTAPNFDCLDVETTLALTSVNGDAASGTAVKPVPPAPDVVLEAAVGIKLIIGAYDGGPAVQKAIVDFGEGIELTQAQLDSAKFGVEWGTAYGKDTDKFVLTDAAGVPVAADVTSSRYATITYTQTFNQYGVGNSVFNYITADQATQLPGVNVWKDLSTVKATMKGTIEIEGTTYNKLDATVTATKEVPALDKWDIDGSYTSAAPADGEAEAKSITLKYATHTPAGAAADTGKNPLIIWLHGQGEGGGSSTYKPATGAPIVFDNKPDIALLGNKVTALAEEGIQKYFTVTDGIQGAYVLVPQSPTMWMDTTGNWTRTSTEKSYYLDALWALIQNYVTTNTDIDANRIYIGGCSNGGFMTMQMIEHHADYFAAAFPIATPYGTSAELIESIKNLPIWFVHSKDDTTVSIADTQPGANWWDPPTFVGFTDKNTNAIYLDLVADATAKDHVWYTLTENVKGDSNNGYSGHYSWIYVFNDQVSKVQAKTGAEGAAMTTADLDPASTATVTVEGNAVSLWGWIAAQSKTAA